MFSTHGFYNLLPPAILLFPQFLEPSLIETKVSHMFLRRTTLLAFLTLTTFAAAATQGASAQTAPQATDVKPTPEKMAADTSRVTPGGAAFTVPAGWSI